MQLRSIRIGCLPKSRTQSYRNQKDAYDDLEFVIEECYLVQVRRHSVPMCVIEEGGRSMGSRISEHIKI